MCACSADVYCLMGLAALRLATAATEKPQQREHFEHSVQFYKLTRDALIVRLQVAINTAGVDESVKAGMITRSTSKRLAAVAPSLSFKCLQ